jgi:predicted small lipoprotein YifL
MSGGSASPAATCPSPPPSPRKRGEGGTLLSERVSRGGKHDRRTLIGLFLVLPLALTGCGKRGPPEPPPGEPVTYPRTYPSE